MSKSDLRITRPKRTVQVQATGDASQAEPFEDYRNHVRDRDAYDRAVRLIKHEAADKEVECTNREIHEKAVRQVARWERQCAEEEASHAAFREAAQRFKAEHGEFVKSKHIGIQRSAVADFMDGEYEHAYSVMGHYISAQNRRYPDRAPRWAENYVRY